MADTQRFRVRFWGVRGSYPTPGPRTLLHGGNTSCIEVQAGAHTLILDAGSGIIGLGHELLQRTKGKSLNVSLLITHAHSDHLLGLPFFAPLFEQRADISFFGPFLTGMNIEQVVTLIMSPPYFPVDIRNLPSTRTFHTIADDACIFWKHGDSEPAIIVDQKEKEPQEFEVRVTAKLTQSHPQDGALIYRIDYAGRYLIYATDVEWQDRCDPDVIAFAQGADLLIHDAQYTTADYQRAKHGFGHSTVEMATDMACAAHVHELVLFHHEPTYDDGQLDQMEAEARTHFAHTYSASEGMEIDLLAQSTKRG